MLSGMTRGDTLTYLIQIVWNPQTGQVASQAQLAPFPPGFAPLDISGGKLWFTLKRTYVDPDSAAVAQLSSPAGGITITSAQSGRATISLPPQATLNFPDGTVQLVYDVQFKDAAGNVTTTEGGPIDVAPDATRTTSAVAPTPPATVLPTGSVYEAFDYAGLLVLDDTNMSTGQLAITANDLTYWVLDKTDNSTPIVTRRVQGTGSGQGRWHWVSISHPRNLARNAWRWDSVLGNDANPGTALLPLLSIGEWERRCCNPTYRPSVARVDMGFVGTPPDKFTGSIDPTGSVIAMTGTPVDIPGAAGTLSAVTIGNSLTNTPWQATGAGLGAQVAANTFVRVTSGPNIGNGAWIFDAGDPLVGNSVPLSQPSTWVPASGYIYGGTQAFSNGDAFVAQTLPVVDVTNLKLVGAVGALGALPGGTGFVTMEFLHVRGASGPFTGFFGQLSSSGIAYVFAKHCFFEKISGGVNLQSVGCKFDTYVPQGASAGLSAFAGLVVNGGIYMTNGTSVFLHNDAVVAGSQVNVTNNCNLNWRSGQAYNSVFASPIATQDAAVLRFDLHSFGGKNNAAPRFQLGAGTQVLGAGASPGFSITGTGPDVAIEDESVANPVSNVTGLLGAQVVSDFSALAGGTVALVNLKHDVYLSPSPTGP